MELLNTLYVTTQRAYLHLDHDTIRVEVDRSTALRMPLVHIEGLVVFGNVLVSPALIQRCGDDGRSIVFLDRNGRFKARTTGPTSGNVLLRRDQHLALAHANTTLTLARGFVAGKIQNTRQIVLRAAREASEDEPGRRLREASEALAECLRRLEVSGDLDGVRGCEGDAARVYFEGFDLMVRAGGEALAFTVRNRRPPRDPMNAALSFAYALVLSDCVSGLEAVGLDPQVGYLHALRPGRPALALDLMEEFRSILADRLVLALVNRRQLTARDFERHPGGAVLLTDSGRRTVVTAYQQRKQDSVRHRILDRPVPIGLLPHVQARLLARHLRGDIPAYCPFLAR